MMIIRSNPTWLKKMSIKRFSVNGNRIQWITVPEYKKSKGLYNECSASYSGTYLNQTFRRNLWFSKITH